MLFQQPGVDVLDDPQSAGQRWLTTVNNHRSTVIRGTLTSTPIVSRITRVDVNPAPSAGSP